MNRVILVTGAARRIGAEIACTFHRAGFDVALHCHRSTGEAQTLADRLNAQRRNSVAVFSAALGDSNAIHKLAAEVMAWQDRVDVLVNNASGFFPTPFEEASEQQWHQLMDSNLKGAFFLCQSLVKSLRKQRGSIINIADIYARSPLAGYSIYCIAKAGNAMLTKALARDLAPQVRVNGIAPGVILWPNHDEQMSETVKQQVTQSVPLQRIGHPRDIADMALFLATGASYITGQIIAVDGGSHLNI